MTQDTISNNELQVLEYQAAQLQQILSNIDSQIQQIQETKNSIQEFDSVSSGQELLFPIANGVYAKGLTTSDKILKINIGSNIVVEKTISETIKMLDSQIHELENYRREVSKQLDTLFMRLK